MSEANEFFLSPKATNINPRVKIAKQMNLPVAEGDEH
jgi:hypothetical protein